MFRWIRKYAQVFVLILMSTFAVCLVEDEYSDMQRAVSDLRIEVCIELETEDFEWDEEVAQDLTPPLSQGEGESSCMLLVIGDQQSEPCVSLKLRLGLVRRYALNDSAQSDNYTLT